MIQKLINDIQDDTTGEYDFSYDVGVDLITIYRPWGYVVISYEISNHRIYGNSLQVELKKEYKSDLIVKLLSKILVDISLVGLNKGTKNSRIDKDDILIGLKKINRNNKLEELI